MSYACQIFSFLSALLCSCPTLFAVGGMSTIRIDTALAEATMLGSTAFDKNFSPASSLNPTFLSDVELTPADQQKIQHVPDLVWKEPIKLDANGFLITNPIIVPISTPQTTPVNPRPAPGQNSPSRNNSPNIGTEIGKSIGAIAGGLVATSAAILSGGRSSVPMLLSSLSASNQAAINNDPTGLSAGFLGAMATNTPNNGALFGAYPTRINYSGQYTDYYSPTVASNSNGFGSMPAAYEPYGQSQMSYQPNTTPQVVQRAPAAARTTPAATARTVRTAVPNQQPQPASPRTVLTTPSPAKPQKPAQQAPTSVDDYFAELTASNTTAPYYGSSRPSKVAQEPYNEDYTTNPNSPTNTPSWEDIIYGNYQNPAPRQNLASQGSNSYYDLALEPETAVEGTYLGE